MNKKQYRKRRRVNAFAKANRISVSRATKILDAHEKTIKALSQLPTNAQRLKVLKAVGILLDLNLEFK